MTRFLKWLTLTVVILLLYRFVPARRIRFTEAVAGALVTAVVLLGISLASGWLYAKAARLSVIYGSLTVALVFLYSVYLYACAVLFGAEVAAAWARPPAADPEPVSRQIKHAIKSLFVHDDEPRRSDRPKSRLSRASGS